MFASTISVALFIARSLNYGSHEYWFLNWNLFLAWLPLYFAWQLEKRLKSEPWSSWQNFGLTFLWLAFLPNSFYVASDLVHLPLFSLNTLLYDVVMLLSYSLNALLLGFISLFIVHRLLYLRIKQRSHFFIGAVLFLCSFAIYLGRYLRWNTWDVLVNPAGLLFDVSDRVINPSSHPQTFVTTLGFFALLGSTYIVIWQIVMALVQKARR